MTNLHSLAFAGLLAVLAVLYQTEVQTQRWEAVDYALIPGDAALIWKFLANVDTTPKWFQWVSAVHQIDARPLSVGKRYETVYKLPLAGEYRQLMEVTSLTPGRAVTLESDAVLKPAVTVTVTPESDGYTRVAFTVRYRRTSALYRVTLGPVMWLLTSQQLQHSLFLLKMMFPA